MEKKIGKVYLVGAGPSDPGLLTLRGKELLDRADLVVYDALIGDGILSMIPADTEAIDVGKRASHHTLPQEQISALLVEKAKEGKEVVRLKGGDPFLFGRGGEEVELLVREGIPFELVPGVTSAVAVPAYQGIPVTHRDYSSSLHVITGHRREGMREEINFQALVGAGGTYVFLMGASALPEICRELMDAGLPEDTPAAFLMRGTTAAQKKIVSTVKKLPSEVERQGSATPAVIVIGAVCSLAERFSWYEDRPLAGVKLLLTRPRELCSDTAAKLRDLGAEVLEVPMIRIVRIPHNERLRRALEQIGRYQWLVFTSRMGVRIFFQELEELKIDRRVFASIKFAVIGEGTARELSSYGFYADLMPETYDAAHLGRALFSACAQTDRILIARAAQGSPDLIAQMQDRFAVDDIPLYETVTGADTRIDLRREFKDGGIDYVLFTSASTVQGFRETLSGQRQSKESRSGSAFDFSRVHALCIGAQSASAARALGMQTIEAKEASMESLTECLLEESAGARKVRFCQQKG